VLISSDLTFGQHVTTVRGQYFYHLRQLRSVRQSLDTESITTLIRAFASSRVDYCCSLPIGSPRSVTDKLQHVLNAAARVITNSSNYDSGLLWPCIMTSTGWMLLNGFSSEWLQLYTSVCTPSLQRIWLNCVHHCVSKSSWWAPVSHNQQSSHTTQSMLQTVNLRHPPPVLLFSLVQSAGTLYRTRPIWSNLTFLLIVLGSN